MNPLSSTSKGVYDSSLIIPTEDFSKVAGKLRNFFYKQSSNLHKIFYS